MIDVDRGSLAEAADLQPLVDFIVYPPESSGAEPFTEMLRRHVG